MIIDINKNTRDNVATNEKCAEKYNWPAHALQYFTLSHAQLVNYFMYSNAWTANGHNLIPLKYLLDENPR